MTVETAIVRNFDTAKDQLSSHYETMHIVTDSNKAHGYILVIWSRSIFPFQAITESFPF